MTEIDLIKKTELLIGKSFGEMPCYRLLEELLPAFPPATFREVGANWLQVGDVVSFGGDSSDPDTSIGVYLGSGKVIASMPGHGVVLVPWRFVKDQFLWGGRCG